MDALLDQARSFGASDRGLDTPGVALDLFGGISMQMCRPLISLRAGFDLLLAGSEGPIEADQRDRVQALRAQCDDLLRLTRSYFEFASLARGPRTFDLNPFRLGALLDESDRRFAARAAARSIRWSCRLDGPDGAVVTDLGAFQRAVGHLVANALEHTPEGGRIDVLARFEAGFEATGGSDPEAGPTPTGWLVEVVDDGRGIAPELVESVFEPLFRAGPGEARGIGGDGHGMGLAICRELVAGLGGETSLDSAVGSGTRVVLRFPPVAPTPA